MAIEKVNVIQSSKNFEGDLKNFINLLDNPEALGRYTLDAAKEMSFFMNFPGIVFDVPTQQKDGPGDILKIEERFNVAIDGPGLP
ncbi:MAG: hypothetical protein NZZ41_07980 [Candidatus Dojkabacteria bacterium]|nr:hypothetical protein [Candidatus Dojkabacteria bacterium]